MVLGLSGSSAAFAKKGLLEAYTPKGVDALKPVFRSGEPAETWVGMDAYLSRRLLQHRRGRQEEPARSRRRGRTSPTAMYKGSLVMPHPASSGTGYLTVAAWLQLMGEAAGWKFMDAVHKNVAVYTHSGSAPCVQAAKGERIIGIGFDMRGAREKTAGAPIEVILPTEGSRLGNGGLGHRQGPGEIAAAKQVRTGSPQRRPTSSTASTTPSSPIRR